MAMIPNVVGALETVFIKKKHPEKMKSEEELKSFRLQHC